MNFRVLKHVPKTSSLFRNERFSLSAELQRALLHLGGHQIEGVRAGRGEVLLQAEADAILVTLKPEDCFAICTAHDGRANFRNTTRCSGAASPPELQYRQKLP